MLMLWKRKKSISTDLVKQINYKVLETHFQSDSDIDSAIQSSGKRSAVIIVKTLSPTTSKASSLH